VRRLRVWAVAVRMAWVCGLIFVGQGVAAQMSAIVLASTTSTEQSGLFAHLLPQFTQATGIAVKVVAVGSGQAIDMARRGDADVLLSHDQPAEEKLAADGFVIKRVPVMYNDFMLVGPASDPAQARSRDVVQALQRLHAGRHLFVSRGDRSGTHAAELRYWKLADLDLPSHPGYKACGCGMGPALNMAASLGAYVLTDRGTWLAYKQRSDLALIVEGDQRLFNPYGVMVVHPLRHAHVRHVQAQQFVDWLTGPIGQAAIAAFRIGGQPLFFPNAPRR
jgi:tungstate transport system substrate-binding protein